MAIFLKIHECIIVINVIEFAHCGVGRHKMMRTCDKNTPHKFKIYVNSLKITFIYVPETWISDTQSVTIYKSHLKKNKYIFSFLIAKVNILICTTTMFLKIRWKIAQIKNALNCSSKINLYVKNEPFCILH